MTLLRDAYDSIRGRAADRLSNWKWQLVSPHWRLPSELRIELRSHVEWLIYNDLFVNGEYDEPLLEALGSADPHRPLLCLDLGANVGFFALRLLDLHYRSGSASEPPRVVSVEGDPRNHRELTRRLDANLPRSASVRAVHGLVGQQTGHGRIFHYHFHGMSTVMTQSRLSRGERVPYVDLAALAPGGIDLLKCDIEGSELMFIENYGPLLRRVRRAVFELHSDKCDTGRCVALLREHGLVHHRRLWTHASCTVDHFWR